MSESQVKNGHKKEHPLKRDSWIFRECVNL